MATRHRGPIESNHRQSHCFRFRGKIRLNVYWRLFPSSSSYYATCASRLTTRAFGLPRGGNETTAQFAPAARRPGDQIKVGGIAAVLSVLVTLAAADQTQAQKAPRVSRILPGASLLNPSKLAGSEENLRGFGSVEGRNIGENSAGKISSASGSGGRRCEMSPEEFAKFYPPLLDGIRTTLTASAHVAQTVASRGFSRLPLYFTEKTLASTKVVLVDPLPMPPLSSMGLVRFADFERGDFDGITYIDTIFLKPNQSNNENMHFHELVSRYSMAPARIRSVFIVVCEWPGMLRLSAKSVGSYGVRC